MPKLLKKVTVWLALCLLPFLLKLVVRKQLSDPSLGRYIPEQSSSLDGGADNNIDEIQVTKQKKVLMLAYMRGGSSLGGTLFNRDPRSLLWYEPLDQFFMAYLGHAHWGMPMHITMNKNATRRMAPSLERELLLDYFANMFSCNYHQLPTETFTHIDFMRQSSAFGSFNLCVREARMYKCKNHIRKHCGSTEKHIRHPEESWRNHCPEIILETKGLDITRTEYYEKVRHYAIDKITLDDFYKHHTCMERVSATLKPCIKKAVDICKSRSIQGAEVLRANMNSLEPLLLKVPDIYVMHYVRDPRAIAASALKLGFSSNSSSERATIVDESRFVCNKMWADIQDFNRLSQKYNGTFFRAKYEDLVTSPEKFCLSVYRHLGLGSQDCSREWKRFIKISLNAQAPDSAMGTTRVNGVENISKWRHNLPPIIIKQINSVCSGVLEALKYNP